MRTPAEQNWQPFVNGRTVCAILSLKSFEKLVGARGFEPPTPSPPDARRSLILLNILGNRPNVPPLSRHDFSFRL